MKKVLYPIVDLDLQAEIYETKKQKDILDVLDEMLENANIYGWSYTFEDDSFYIEYYNGDTYEAVECGEYGVYKKKNIKRIIYSNPNDTWVYGSYKVNEYGNVY